MYRRKLGWLILWQTHHCFIKCTWQPLAKFHKTMFQMGKWFFAPRVSKFAVGTLLYFRARAGVLGSDDFRWGLEVDPKGLHLIALRVRLENRNDSSCVDSYIPAKLRLGGRRRHEQLSSTVRSRVAYCDVKCDTKRVFVCLCVCSSVP